MREMFRLTIPLALVMMLAVACSETKKTVPGTDDLTSDETVTDTAATDEIAYDEDATGDKDDVFAEGPLSDDSPMINDDGQIVNDDGQVVNDDGEPITDEIMTDETPDDDSIIGPDVPPTDVDIVPGTCTEGTYRLTASVYYRVGNQNVPGGGTLAFNPVGAADSEGNLACYAPDTTVTMTLTLETDYTFSQWRGPDAGDVLGEFPTFTIVMDAEKTVRALVVAPVDPDADIVGPDLPQPDTDVVPETCPTGYKLAPYVYYQQGSQRIVGGGSIAMSPTGSNSSQGNPVCYVANTTVNMTVTVDEGYTWDQWRGTDAAAVTGSFPNFSIVVDADKDVRARVTAN